MLKPGDYVIIRKDAFLGYLGKNVTELKQLIGRVVKVRSVDKENNKIELEIEKGMLFPIPFKNWKDVVMKFEDVKKKVGWRKILSVQEDPSRYKYKADFTVLFEPTGEDDTDEMSKSLKKEISENFPDIDIAYVNFDLKTDYRPGKVLFEFDVLLQSDDDNSLKEAIHYYRPELSEEDLDNYIEEK
jgi:hypothetical protein